VSTRILIGDCRDKLRELPNASVHCCVTSPPYFGLRDYGLGSSGIGLEETVDEHMNALVSVFREVRRVLRDDGTLWVNYGDAYAGSWGAQGRGDKRSEMDARASLSEQQIAAHPKRRQTGALIRTGGCKAKDLMGLPWQLAFALRADGWWLRQDIIWSKPNPMPESIRDRCTKAHEYLFLLAKSERYFYDAEAIKEEAVSDHGSGNGFDGRQGGALHMPMSGGMGSTEPWTPKSKRKIKMPDGWDTGAGGHGSFHRKGREKGETRELGSKGEETPQEVRSSAGARMGRGAGWRDDPSTSPDTRNKRSVWHVPSAPFSEAHFATFPPALIEPCILAGCPEGGTVLDPFGGAGTTGLVADRLGRDAILIELNPDYAAIAERRIAKDGGLFAEVKAA
jgi:DNA modification methylase